MHIEVLKLFDKPILPLIALGIFFKLFYCLCLLDFLKKKNKKTL